MSYQFKSSTVASFGQTVNRKRLTEIAPIREPLPQISWLLPEIYLVMASLVWLLGHHQAPHDASRKKAHRVFESSVQNGAYGSCGVHVRLTVSPSKKCKRSVCMIPRSRMFRQYLCFSLFSQISTNTRKMYSCLLFLLLFVVILSPDTIPT